MKIDAKDAEILSILDTNSRLNAREIEKLTGIPKQVIRYRLSKLVSSGIIEGFYATVDYRKLNFSIYNVLLKMSPSSEEEEKSFMKFLYMHKNAVYIIKLMGSWDYYIALAIKNNSELNDFIDNLKKLHSKSIINYDILTGIEDYAFSAKYFYPKKFLYKIYADIMSENEKKNLLLKPEDKIILKIMVLNPLFKLTEVVLQTKFSFNSVKSKINNIFTNNIITRIRPSINLKKIGYLRFLVFMKFKPESKNSFNNFIIMAKSSPNIVFISKCLGQYDVIVDLIVENIESLKKVLFDVYNILEGSISKADVIPVYEELKTAATIAKDSSKRLPFD